MIRFLKIVFVNLIFREESVDPQENNICDNPDVNDQDENSNDSKEIVEDEISENEVSAKEDDEMPALEWFRTVRFYILHSIHSTDITTAYLPKWDELKTF